MPFAEPTTTGCWAAPSGGPVVTPPTASHPAAPYVTLVSCWIPGRVSVAEGWPAARVHEVPPSVEVQAAG